MAWNGETLLCDICGADLEDEECQECGSLVWDTEGCCGDETWCSADGAHMCACCGFVVIGG